MSALRHGCSAICPWAACAGSNTTTFIEEVTGVEDKARCRARWVNEGSEAWLSTATLRLRLGNWTRL